MSNVIKLNSDEWRISVEDVNIPMRQRVKFASSPIVFNVEGRFIDHDGTSYLLTVTPEPKDSIDRIKYAIGYRIHATDDSGPIAGRSGTLDETIAANSMSVNLNMNDGHVIISNKLTLKKVTFVQVVHAMNPDLERYIERGPTVTLIGSDGTVSVPRRLLKMRSEALENMFKHDLQEKRTGQVKLEEFDIKALSAFKQFLMTDKIENGKETVLGLILLADKYDIQSMKKAAEEFVKKNIREMDQEEVLDILHKVSPGTVVDAMVDSWSKE